MRSKKGNNSGQKSHCNSRYNRSHNSDNRRTNKNSNQVNSFAKTNQRVLLDVLEYRPSAHMYQGNGFRSFSNSQTYGNTPHQQVPQVNVDHHLNSFNVQDHFHNHAANFRKLLTNNHSYPGSALKSFGTPPSQEQFGTLNINNPARSSSNNQGMNFSISNPGRCNSRERFGESSAKSAKNTVSQGSSYSRHQGLSDGSYSQTNKMCEVFNDVLGEKPPESNSGKSSNHLNIHLNPYGNSVSPFDSPLNITTRNQNYNRYKWRRDDRPNKSKSQQGNLDPNPTWEPGTNHDRRQRSRDRPKRPNHHNSDNRQDADKDDQSKESARDKQQAEEARKSTDTTSSKEASMAKDGQASHEKAAKPKKLETTVVQSSASGTLNANNDKKNSHNNNKNNNSNSKEKESIKEKPTSKEKKSTSGIGKGKLSQASTSSSGSDTDCVIEEEDDQGSTKPPSTPLPLSTGELMDSVKSKSKAIMQSSSSATARPSHPANMGISPNLRKDPSSDKKKKKETSKKKDAPPSTESEKKSMSNAAPSTTSSNASAPNTATIITTASSSTAQNTLKKPMSTAALLKLITPRSRKDQQRAEQLMKQYSEKRDRTSAQGPLSANSTALSQSLSLESPFSLDHLDLANLDFKVLKTDIPEELSEVINKVLDFSSTEKNPIVLDDDEETVRQAKKGRPERTSSRKRKYSENFGSRKKRKDQEAVSMMSNDNANTEEQSSSRRCVDKSDSSKDSSKEIIEGSQPEEASIPASDSIIPSISPAAANPSPGRPSPPGILGTLLQLSLKEDEIQGHIANLDLEIQALQGMIVDLSHKLNSKKHHRDMMMNEEKRLKAFRIQALVASVDSNKMSPDLHQQLLNCLASSRLPGESFISEENDLSYQMEDQDLMPSGDKIINIVPQSEGLEDYELAGRDEIQSKASACNSVPLCGDLGSPNCSQSLLQTSKPILSPPPRSLENTGSHVRYLGTLNDISHLFRKPGSINSEPIRGSELGLNTSPGLDVRASSEDSADKHGTDEESADNASNDISKIKSELADKNFEN